jgi:uncharacterized membrane protein (DUF2068 family)
MPHHPPKRSDVVIRLIAVFKLIKAATLIALGIGVLSLRHDHSWLSQWIHAISADPHGKYVTELLAKVTSSSARALMYMGVGSMIYAGVFLIEGVGLMLKKPWAEMLTVIVTVSFIPIEIYELVEHATWMKALVIVINAAAAVYLLWRLRREHHWPFKHAAVALFE